MPIFFLLVALAVLPAEWAVGQALKGRFSIWACWSAGGISAQLYRLSVTIRL